MKDVYNKRLSRQGERRDLTSNKVLLEVPPNVQAAKAIGKSQPTADRAAAVVTAIDNLESGGKKRDAEQLRSILNNKSINKAYEQAQEAGLIPTRVPSVISREANQERQSSQHLIKFY